LPRWRLEIEGDTMKSKLWRVGWKPIGKASANPQWSGVIFDNFTDASHVAASLNRTDWENHYFPDMVPDEKPEQCSDCGQAFNTEIMKSPPDPGEKGRLCPFCHEHAVSVLKANPK
jgi:hypothetical protein